MTDHTTRRILLVSLALVALVFAAPVVSAHGNDAIPGDAPPVDGDADDWATWMRAHMTDHMGPGADAWMESHMSTSIDEMAQYMAGGDHPRGSASGGHC